MAKIVALHLFSAVLSFSLAGVSWRKRNVRPARQLAALMLAVGWWALFEAAITLAPGTAAKLFWVQVQYLGMAFAAPLFLECAIAYSDVEGPIVRVARAVVWPICTATVAMVWTNSLHSLYWRGAVLDATGMLLVFERGPWFWVFITGSYIAVLTGITVVGALVLHSGRQLRAQAYVVLAAALLPMAANALYNSGLIYIPGLDWTPITFSLTGLLLVFATLRLGFLALVPVARGIVVETMGDGVLVLDHGGRLVDINPAAARMAGIELVQGQAPSGLPAPIAAVLAAADGELQTEVTLSVAGRSRVVELRVSPFGAQTGRPLGRLVILRDITERRVAEQERERLFADLQSAVAEIRTLRGLLPICSSCKRVRDDSGYWNQIETYISAHADVRFSHGLCPDCARRLYPEVFAKPGQPGQPGPEAG